VTTYVILRATNEPGTIFAIDGEQDASSPERAITIWAKSSGDADIVTFVYAAVPKRSWRPVRIDIEVRETVKVTRL